MALSVGSSKSNHNFYVPGKTRAGYKKKKEKRK